MPIAATTLSVGLASTWQILWMVMLQVNRQVCGVSCVVQILLA